MRRSVSLGVAGALVLVSAGALTAAPVSAEEVGTDDIKLTTGVDPRDAEVSYDPVNDRHLLVWSEVTAGGERIRGQVVTAAGAAFAGPFDIASPSVAGGITADPAVTWDATRNRWVVAYVTDETALGARDIAVATVTAAGTPAVVGLVSDMGDTAGDGAFDAAEPDIAYNVTSDQFLVVWRGDDNATVNGEDEIFGQRLAGNTLGALGVNDFRVTTTGANGDTNIDARRPSLVWNPVTNAYAVAYEQLTGLVPQAVLANPVSATGNPGTAVTVAAAGAGVERGHPAIAVNDSDGGYGVVWEAYTTASAVSQIEGRLMTSALAASTAFPALSTTGVDASGPEIVANDTIDRYGVVWDSNTGTEREIFGAVVSITATIVEPVSRLSTMGVNGTASTIPVTPSISVAAGGAFQTIWESDNVDAAAAPNNTAAGDIEIFGQKFQVNGPPTVTINQAAGQPDPTNAASVQFTAVFSESVTGFAGTDVTLTGAGAAGATVAVAGGPSTYTVTVSGLTANGPITATIPANVVLDASSQGNSASTSTDNTVTRDATAPTVTTGLAPGQPSGTNATTARFSVTFSENVTGFAVGDITLDTTGSATGTVTAVADGPSIYTVTVSSLAGVGTMGIRVPAGSATDAAGNGNTASAAFLALAIDRVAPTVTINQAVTQTDPTNTSPIAFTATFSETVSGFDDADVVLGGTAPGTLTATNIGIGPSYPLLVQGMTGDGTVTATIPAGVVTDAFGNANVASTSTDNSVTYDATRPGVSLVPVTASPTSATSLVTTVNVTEPVTGLTVLDVVVAPAGVSFGTVTLVPTGPTTYTLTVGGVSGSGTLQVSIPANAAQDSAGNVNTASNVVSFTVDQAAPTATVTRAAGAPNPTNATSLPFTVTVSEAVTGVDLSDFTVVTTGTATGTVQTVTGGPSVYTVTVASVAGDGTVRLDLNGAGTGIADAAGNPVAGVTGETFTVDTTRPSVTVEQAAVQADPTNTTPVTFTVTFSEAVTGFDETDVAISGTVGGAPVVIVTGGPLVYTATVTGVTGTGTVVAAVPGDSATDAAGNTNTASTSVDNTVLFDDVRPTISIISVLSPTNAPAANFIVTTSEPVTGLDASDVVLTTDVGGTATLISTGPNTYALTVAPVSGVGSVSVSFADGAADDAAGNASTASNTATIVVDQQAPTVTITRQAGAPNPSRGPTVAYTVTFSEPVTGVGVLDFSVNVTGTLVAAVGTVSGGPSVYTVTVDTLGGVGTVGLDLNSAGTGIIDAATNPAPGATGPTFDVDMEAPTVTIEQAAGQADPTSSAPVSFTVTFSEPVTGFDAADVDLGGSSAPGTLVAAVTGSGAVYTVDVTGMTAPGVVVAAVPAGAASDAAANASTASTSVDNAVTFDGTPPVVTVEQAVGQADPTNATPIRFTVTFSEPVIGFASADVVIAGTAGATTAVVSGAGADYTVEISGMTGFGTVVVTVAAGAASDASGNASLASSSNDNTVTYVPGDPNPGVNDPPIVTAPASISAELGVALVMNGARTITVADPDSFNATISVTVSAPNATFTLPVSPGLVVAPGSASITITGSQAAINGAITSLSVTFSETGPITMTVLADDLGQQPLPALTGTATIAATVVDTTPPVIEVPAPVVVANNDIGRASAVVVYLVTVTDQGRPPATNRLTAAAPPTFACTPPSGSTFVLGTTTVTCTAQDPAGNTATATFRVQVNDTERPTITVPATQQVNFPAGATSGVVNYPAPTATDNSGQVTVSCTPASGSSFRAGSTTVTCTATDPSGNAATATFQVIASSGNLPITGGGGGSLVPPAFALVLAGLVLVMGSKRRRPRPA